MKRLLFIFVPWMCFADPPPHSNAGTPTPPITNYVYVTNYIYVTNVLVPPSGMWVTNLNVNGTLTIAGTNDGSVTTYSGTNVTGHLP